MIKQIFKKIFCSLVCVILCLILCACSDNRTYIKQDEINFNYNNISAGSPSYWIEGDAFFYSQHNFVFDIYKMNDNGRQQIASSSNPDVDFHVYDGKLYYDNTASFLDDTYIIKSYDLTTRKTSTVAKIKTERLCNYFIVGDIIFAETGYEENFQRDLQCVSLKTEETAMIAKNIVTCGIVNDKIRYVKQINDSYSVFEYDEVNNRSISLGTFNIKLSANEEISPFANFTLDKVILTVDDSRLLIFNISDSTLKTCTPGQSVYSAVAYSDYLFFTDNNSLSRLCIDTLEIEKIAEFRDITNVFVTSDDDAYISILGKDEILHCTSDGVCETVVIANR